MNREERTRLYARLTRVSSLVSSVAGDVRDVECVSICVWTRAEDRNVDVSLLERVSRRHEDLISVIPMRSIFVVELTRIDEFVEALAATEVIRRLARGDA